MIKSGSLLDAQYQNEKPASNDCSSEEEIDGDIFDEGYYSDLLDSVRSTFESVEYTDMIHGISCGAHCIHLVVFHAIEKSPETKALIDRCRELAKKLRTPTFRSLQLTQAPQAKIDVKTRWNSVFDMVQYKPFVFNVDFRLVKYVM